MGCAFPRTRRLRLKNGASATIFVIPAPVTRPPQLPNMWNHSALSHPTPQKEAQCLALMSIGGALTKPSTSRQPRRSFAPDGGTSRALSHPDFKIFVRPREAGRRCDRPPDRPLLARARRTRSLMGRGVAVADAVWMRLTLRGRMIRSTTRKRCTNSISSAFLPPPPSAVALAQSAP
jgi:hypothetical protein